MAAKTVGKNALHFDLHVDSKQERDQVVQRARSIGATVIDEVSQAGVSWVVLADPEGNHFCVVNV